MSGKAPAGAPLPALDLPLTFMGALEVLLDTARQKGTLRRLLKQCPEAHAWAIGQRLPGPADLEKVRTLEEAFDLPSDTLTGRAWTLTPPLPVRSQRRLRVEIKRSEIEARLARQRAEQDLKNINRLLQELQDKYSAGVRSAIRRARIARFHYQVSLKRLERQQRAATRKVLTQRRREDRLAERRRVLAQKDPKRERRRPAAPK